MNKSELIDAIARHADISKAAAGRALDATVDAIRGSLKKGDIVTLVGFGSFYVGKRTRAPGRNPRTNEPDQDPRRQSAQVPRWKSAQGCAKLADFAGSGTGRRCSGETLHVPGNAASRLPGCLAQLVERRPYKANVGEFEPRQHPPAGAQ